MTHLIGQGGPKEGNRGKRKSMGSDHGEILGTKKNTMHATGRANTRTNYLKKMGFRSRGDILHHML